MVTRTRRTAWLAMAAAVGLSAGVARADGDAPVEGLEYPSFGVSLVGPTGWYGKVVASKYVVARWQLEDPETHAPRGVVEVRALPAKGMTLRQFADAVGRQIGGNGGG